eukprot:2517890-Rhodomonas_salina.1
MMRSSPCSSSGPGCFTQASLAGHAFTVTGQCDWLIFNFERSRPEGLCESVWPGYRCRGPGRGQSGRKGLGTCRRRAV